MNRKELLEMLRNNGTPEEKVVHCDLVADVSLIIAKNLVKKGKLIDLEIVEAGAALHDIGISVTWDDLSPQHGVIGGDICRNIGLSEKIARCVESHELLGLPIDEAKQLRINTNRNTLEPQTWEEKIVMFADHVVLAWAECEQRLWDDPLCLVKANYPYLRAVFKRWAKIDITPNHPCNYRGLKVYKEMISFIQEKEVGPLETKACFMREALLATGVKVPFSYENKLEFKKGEFFIKKC